MDNIVRGVLYYSYSMVLGQFFCRFTGSEAQTHCARRPQLVSKKFFEEEIFAGTNFRELAFDRENCENFCLAKISRYTVCVFQVVNVVYSCQDYKLNVVMSGKHVDWDGKEEWLINRHWRTVCCTRDPAERCNSCSPYTRVPSATVQSSQRYPFLSVWVI